MSSNIYPEYKTPLGRPLKYKPEELVEKFKEYIQWCKDNPIVREQRQQGFSGQNSFGKTETEELPRLVSIGGFLTFIGGDDTWWCNLEKGKQGATFFKVKASIKNFCENYQKEMASNGMFNANIISRLLGLADKKMVEASGDSLTVIVKSKEEKGKVENIADLNV